MKISVIGTGYVGLVAGACFADGGNDVLCLDVDEEKVSRLAAGEPTIYEPGLGEIVKRSLREGRLEFTTDYLRAVEHSRMFFLCLPTPPAEDFSADVRCVHESVIKLSKILAETSTDADEPAIFVLKSTVPVGTNQQIRKLVSEHFDGKFSIVNNPEFLKEGTAVDDFLKPDRVVIGTSDEWSGKRLRELYEPFCRTGAPILIMDPASAEITKYAANGFLAMKISYINEIARLCEKAGADVEEVRKAICLDERIGKTFLFPGIGYGGSCLPKDTRALVASAKAFGLDFYTVDAAEKVNVVQKTWLFPKILKHFSGSIEGKTFAMWGLAFKPRTDDIRDAPAPVLIEKLISAGASVRAFDPEAMENVKKQIASEIYFAENPYDAITGADALILATEWNEFRSPDWKILKKNLKNPVIFDGRNIFDPQQLKDMGFDYYGVGR